MLKEMDKGKLVKIALGAVGAIVLIIVILLIFHAITAKKSGYSDVENKLLNAAKNYYKENENLLPKSGIEELSIDDATLTSLGYLKSLNDLVNKDNVTCTGKVVITYNDGKYRYTPLLDCGDAYMTKTLASYIEKNEEKVFSGDGLYELNGELVYRGEKPNNYIKFSGELYRIVKLVDGQAVLIMNNRYQRTVWDDRYNADRKRSDGINDYTVSRLREYLDEAIDGNKLISSDDKELLSPFNLYIGKRSEIDSYNDGTIEKSEYLENQYIGVLPLYDYINASIDTNCVSAKTNSCKNYNYLNYFDYNWWTVTADSTNSYRVYRISNSGTIDTMRAVSSGYIRPVIQLVSDAIYVSGNGTKDSPYVVK